jgi:ribonuclease HII
MNIQFGIDEVGRGALAGPVVVGIVGLDADSDTIATLLDVLGRKRLIDSKMMPARLRKTAFEWLEPRIIWAVGESSPAEIDEIGLSKAVTLAAGRAIDGVGCDICSIRADAGLRHPYEYRVSTSRHVKGDELFAEISLASIMAKVWRDRIMQKYDEQHQEYDFSHNVGYGTKKHYEAIREHGILSIHRRLFLKNLN